MSDSALIKKLQLKPGMRLLLLNAPEGYRARLGDLTIHETPDGSGYDFVQVFAANASDLTRLAAVAVQTAKQDGILWLCYPKLTGAIASDLSRDRVWALAAPLGIRPVAQVAVDDTWSALRFRPSQAGEHQA